MTAPAGEQGLHDASLGVDDVNRTYSYYVPAHLPTNPPLLFALHGKGGNGKSMRRQTWFEFDALADQYGFIIAYPDGRDAVWVSCFPGIQSESDRAMEDVAFVRAMISQFHADYGIDRSRVFGVGFSSGGFMAYRFALEMPDEIAAVAAVSASLQADATKVCHPSGKPIPILIMNGTSDPLVPYEGGRTAPSNTLVLSARATAEYFATLNRQTSVPTTTHLPNRGFSDRGSVDRTVWNDPGKREVVLLSVNGGMHQFPVWPQDLDGPAEIWDFFSRQSGSK